MKQLPCPSLLVLGGLLLSGCDLGVSLAPEPDTTFRRLEVSPAAVEVVVARPLNTVRLEAVARDGADRAMPHGGLVVYSTSNSRVASVDRDGTITVFAAGVATIQATLRLGERVRTASVTVTAVPPEEDGIPDGVYEFVGVPEVVLGWDHVDPRGDTYVADLTFLRAGGGVSRLRHLVPAPGAEQVVVEAGPITRAWLGLDRVEVALLEAEGSRFRSALTLWVHEATPGLLRGRFTVDDTTHGSFTARRR